MIAFDGPVQKPLPDAFARQGPHATRVSNPAARRIHYQSEQGVFGGAAKLQRAADLALGLRLAQRLRTRLRGRRSGQSAEESPCRVLARRTGRCALRRGELAEEVEARAGRSSSSAEWHILKRLGVSRKIRPSDIVAARRGTNPPAAPRKRRLMTHVTCGKCCASGKVRGCRVAAGAVENGDVCP